MGDELKELLDARRRAVLEDVQRMRATVPPRVAVIGDNSAAAWLRALLSAGSGDVTLEGPGLNQVGVEMQDRNEEPIRLTFGKRREPAGKVTNAQVKKLRAHEQVTAQDGRAYDGAKTGNLRVKGGSARVHRRRLGLSGRQWRKRSKARRRGTLETMAVRKRVLERIDREWSVGLGAVQEDSERLQARLERLARRVPRSPFWGTPVEDMLLVRLMEGLDDLGNPIAHDLGVRDLGEHGA